MTFVRDRRVERVNDFEGVAQIGRAGASLCARHRDGRVRCQPGLSWLIADDAAAAVELPLAPATGLACSGDGCCGWSDAGVAECVGNSKALELGAQPRRLPITGVDAVALNRETACAHGEHGTQCWGEPLTRAFGEGWTPPGDAMVFPGRHACTLSNGELTCRGDEQPWTLSSVTSVALGDGATACAVLRSGGLHCWGATTTGSSPTACPWPGGRGAGGRRGGNADHRGLRRKLRRDDRRRSAVLGPRVGHARAPRSGAERIGECPVLRHVQRARWCAMPGARRRRRVRGRLVVVRRHGASRRHRSRAEHLRRRRQGQRPLSLLAGRRRQRRDLDQAGAPGRSRRSPRARPASCSPPPAVARIESINHRFDEDDDFVAAPSTPPQAVRVLIDPVTGIVAHQNGGCAATRTGKVVCWAASASPTTTRRCSPRSSRACGVHTACRRITSTSAAWSMTRSAASATTSWASSVATPGAAARRERGGRAPGRRRSRSPWAPSTLRAPGRSPACYCWGTEYRGKLGQGRIFAAIGQSPARSGRARQGDAARLAATAGREKVRCRCRCLACATWLPSARTHGPVGADGHRDNVLLFGGL